MPTFEEFKNKVYQSYKKSLQVHDQNEVDEYFKSEEAEQEMRNEYDNLVKRVKNGEIEKSVILTGGAGGCAQCLVLMF